MITIGIVAADTTRGTMGDMLCVVIGGTTAAFGGMPIALYTSASSVGERRRFWSPSCCCCCCCCCCCSCCCCCCCCEMKDIDLANSIRPLIHNSSSGVIVIPPPFIVPYFSVINNHHLFGSPATQRMVAPTACCPFRSDNKNNSHTLR